MDADQKRVELFYGFDPAAFAPKEINFSTEEKGAALRCGKLDFYNKVTGVDLLYQGVLIGLTDLTEQRADILVMKNLKITENGGAVLRFDSETNPEFRHRLRQYEDSFNSVLLNVEKQEANFTTLIEKLMTLLQDYGAKLTLSRKKLKT
ncbi:hypothetical protein [Falsihalocynthiibacter arcticus]|uniref:Uncharacterized protein n=1 Tax=Falsihalocynthiibacter arcticus TaxID=1579316 RepID=A0A126UX07_9RHOB|nr:hypothetical protein [Falsihalocynthiibacter arcticus]AML49969.1 hypothetical protein RC74_00545 [Falsihalocynthiibacter arcticus]